MKKQSKFWREKIEFEIDEIMVIMHFHSLLRYLPEPGAFLTKWNFFCIPYLWVIAQNWQEKQDE